MFLTKIKLFLALMRGGNVMVMVDVYVTLIINKRRTIDQVPVSIRELVLADLNALGFDGQGNPLPVTEG